MAEYDISQNPLRPNVDVNINVNESVGIDEAMDGECEKVNFKRGPREPSAEERRNHEVLHLPYRSWCSCCVRARAVSSSHSKIQDRERLFAGIHFDYWFMRNNRADVKINCLSMKDDESKGRGGYVVEKKGRCGILGRKL